MAAAADSSQRIALEAAGTLPVFEALVELPAAQTSSIELSRLVALQSELESMAGAVAERQQELANHLASLTQLHAQRFASAPSTYPRRSVVSVQASPTKGGAGRLAKNSRKRARLSTDSVDLPSTAEVMPVEAPPHPFWVGIEEYFREPTQAEIDALAARAQDTTPAPELMIVPPLGRHYLELWKEQEYIRQADSNATNSARFSAKPLQVAEPSGGPLAERLAASLLDHATTRPSHKHFLQHLPSHVNPPVPAEQRSRQLESELKQQLVALGILSETDDGEEIAGDEAPSTSVRRACSGRGSGVGRSGSGSCDSPQDEILAELRTVQRDYQAQVLLSFFLASAAFCAHRCECPYTHSFLNVRICFKSSTINPNPGFRIKAAQNSSSCSKPARRPIARLSNSISSASHFKNANRHPLPPSLSRL
eukprot:m.84383 g.84383  ORF g.84383 m.84383 type:complete len:423 (+) comp8344_c0_seq2:7-1275(+)